MGSKQFQALISEFNITPETLETYSLLRSGPWENPAHRILKNPMRGPIMLVPGNRHYSWPKAASVFGLGSESIWTITLDKDGRLDLADLKQKLTRARSESRPIICVVSVAGTTELGEIDPIEDVQAELDRLESQNGMSIWHHVDAAYGGYMTTLVNSQPAFLSKNIKRSLEAIRSVDSVTIDPHKLGYVPYACGAFLCRDENRYRSFRVQAPYLQDKAGSFAGWATTLEGSRSAAGAAAVWLLSKACPLKSGGFGRILEKTILARDIFSNALSRLPMIRLVTPADTNVLCFTVARPLDELKSTNENTLSLFHQIESGSNFSVSRTTLLRANYSKMIERLCEEWGLRDDGASDLTVIRLVLMNPFIASKESQTDFAEEFAREVEAKLSVVRA